MVIDLFLNLFIFLLATNDNLINTFDVTDKVRSMLIYYVPAMLFAESGGRKIGENKALTSRTSR